MARKRPSTVGVGSPLVRSAYDVLGIGIGVSEARVRAAYMRLAKEHHPDKGGDVERMAAITEAWAILRDPAERRAHDELLRLRGEDPEPCGRCGGAGERVVGLRGKVVECAACGGSGRKV